MEKEFEYYKMIRYQVQLEEVFLESMECKRFDQFSRDHSLSISLQHKSEIIDSHHSLIYLKVEAKFEENKGPFEVSVGIRGKCKATEDIGEVTLLEFSNDQTVSLLLPYAREVISNTLARMGLPIYYLPTMDVLNSLRENKSSDPESFDRD